MSQRKIIFFHLPKTGGTALREILLAPFLRDEVQLIYHRENFQAELRDFVRNRKLIAAGHMGWELDLAQVLQDVTKITCLRNPVSNVISHHLHFRHSNDPAHKEYSSLSFPEFLQTPFANNWQCQRLGGRFYDSQMDEQKCFAEAWENVSSRFDAVGVTERMDDTLLVLRQVLKLNLQQVPMRNLSADPVAANDLQAYADEIKERNQLDEKLHQAAVKRLDAQLG